MGLIKTTKRDTLVVAGLAEKHYQEAPALLSGAGFAKVTYTGSLGEITAVHRSATLRGTITLHVTEASPSAPGPNATSRIEITAKADVDNLFPLGENPATKLIEKYRLAIGSKAPGSSE